MIRGENNCAQHRSKGTTLDTKDEGKTTPKVLCEKGPEKKEEKSAAAHDSDWRRRKLHDTHTREGESKK